jgi:scyllo-inositol 2-dehydrogenase (NADP+)
LIIMAVLNVGLVGFGLAGSVFHAPLISAEPRLRLAAVATSRPLTAEFAAARTIGDPYQLMEAADIDLVVVAAPNASHAPLARAALLAGKHVVVDKPFTLELKEADELIALARERNRLLTVFHNRRWDGNFLTVRELLAQGVLGEVYFAEFHFDRHRPIPKKGWREQPVPGAGALYDLGSHLIDQALCLFGRPDTVWADVTAQRDGVVVDDYFHVQLGYARRRVILHASALVPRPGPRFIAHGTVASLFQYGMDAQEPQLAQGLRPGHAQWGVAPAVSVRLGDGAGERPVPVIPGAYERFYHGVAAAVLDGAAPPVSPAEARAVMMVLDAVRRSTAEGVRFAVE